MKFNVICFVINNSFARESFEFNLGEKINVLSDKAFRQTHENEFEAVGNVVISHLKNSIYGEKAKLNFNSGETEVEGNVRYISPAMTLYGTKLAYNFISREIHLTNARVVSDSYSVVGKNISQTEPTIIVAEDAEYTTCKDCPESWSVYGKHIFITIGKYVKIQHAFIKINGVIAMYIPYIVFPIKQNRESGLLFPNFSFKANEGLKFQQPFFWAISDHNDLTLTPSIFGNRGPGGEFQFRQTISEKTWLQFNSIALGDEVYLPYKNNTEITGQKIFRDFSDLEFHSTYKHYFNNHFYFNKVSDLDVKQDFDFFSKNKILGTDYGGGGFFDWRNSIFNFAVESYYNQNMFVPDPRLFDDQYVQLLPKLSLSTVPLNLIHTKYPFIKNISFGLNSDYSVFKQNKSINSGYIRNADRFNFIPYLDWQLGNIGPVYFSHLLKLDYQSYRLPNEKLSWFQKGGLIYQTQAKFELSRIFGLAYQEEIPQDTINNSTPIDQNLIGNLPANLVSTNTKLEYRSNSSYRHSQDFILNHYYLSDQNYKGNQSFLNQIYDDKGQFDYVDALRSKEHMTNQITSEDSLPLSNTIEFQWNNTLIRKTSKIFDPYIDGKYLKDNFDYSNIFYFNVSQGIDLNINQNQLGREVALSDRLTRLYANTGLTVENNSLVIQEYFYHRTSEHKFYTEMAHNFSKSKLSGRFTYNSFNSSNTPKSKLAGINFELYLNDLFTLKTTQDYDIQAPVNYHISQSSYAIIYTPINNCWKTELNYSKNLVESRIGFVFYINYSDHNFASINVH